MLNRNTIDQSAVNLLDLAANSAYKSLFGQAQPSQVPLVVQAAFAHGCGGTLVELSSRVYGRDEAGISAQLREVIQAVNLCECKNPYGAAFYAHRLIDSGWSLDQVKGLFEHAHLPGHIAQPLRWQRVLRMLPGMIEQPLSARQVSEFVSDTVDMQQDYAAELAEIVVLSRFHKLLLETYAEEIDMGREAAFRGRAHARELETYLRARVDAAPPFITLCMMCKDVKSAAAEWLPVEATLVDLQAGLRISHGLCPACMPEREIPEE